MQQKDLQANLQALPMFGVDDLYVSARSLRERGLAEERLALAVEVLDDQALRDLLQRYDQVITLMATTLHVLSRSPFNDGRLGSCLYLLNPGDGLLLCGDAVHALLAGSHACQALELMPAEIELFALLEDLQARGIEDVPARLVAVDYPGFVELATRFDKVNSWL